MWYKQMPSPNFALGLGSTDAKMFDELSRHQVQNILLLLRDQPAASNRIDTPGFRRAGTNPGRFLDVY
jgi:hypothetical protein